MNEKDMKLALKCRLIAEHTGGIYADSLQAFADLIRKNEREACAKLCEDYTGQDYDTVSDLLAEAIRARGNK